MGNLDTVETLTLVTCDASPLMISSFMRSLFRLSFSNTDKVEADRRPGVIQGTRLALALSTASADGRCFPIHAMRVL